jgi:hypothetical protein
MSKSMNFLHREDVYWALWNDCNGIFGDTIRYHRGEALALQPSHGAECSVVPVLVEMVPKRHWEYLAEAEAEHEKWLSAGSTIPESPTGSTIS